MTTEEELDFFKRVEAGDREAENVLLKYHYPLAMCTAIELRYHHHRFPLADLIQAASIGLLIAIRRFDCEKGFQFSSYAVHLIRSEIFKAIKAGYPIRIPQKVSDSKRPRYVEIDAEWEQNDAPQREFPPTIDETPEQLAELDAVTQRLSVLDDREQAIVTRALGLFSGETETYEQIGDSLGVTRAAIHAAYRKAIGKLRRAEERLDYR